MKMNPASPMNAFPPHSVMQPMKKLHPYSLLFVAVCAALLHLATPAARAADANPPGKLTYQGFLTDASGVPLGNTAPFNTNIIFRIYTAATGGTLKWAESQVVTLDKGHFSVLLGEGSAVAGETAAYTNNLSGIFTGVDASDRFMQISVGAGIIAPRLQFLPAPYALLARSANQVVSPAGSNILSVIANGNVGINNASPVSALDVGGTVTSTGLKVNGDAQVTGVLSGSGASLVNLNAANISSGVLASDRFSGTYSSALTLNNTANSFSGNGALLTALNGANIASGTVADARLSTAVTTGVGLANEATSLNTPNALVKRDANGAVAVGSLTATNIVTTSLTAADGVNGFLPPYVIQLGNKVDTLNWFSIIVPSAIIKKYLGGPNGGTIVYNLRSNSSVDDQHRTWRTHIYMENPTYSNNRLPGIYSWARSQDGFDTTAYLVNTTTRFEVTGRPWGWIYCRNYHSPETAPFTTSAPFADYALEFLTPPDISATIILYNF